MGFANWLHRRSAIRWFSTELPSHLVEDHGHGGPYTLEQIATTIHRSRPSLVAFCGLAQILFCDEAGLARLRITDRARAKRQISWFGDTGSSDGGQAWGDHGGHGRMGHGGFGDGGGHGGH